MTNALAAALLCFQVLVAQTAPANDPWRKLNFLEGTWEAKTRRAASGIDASGTYTFQKELGGHLLVRYTNATGCQGPTGTDCDHKDLLYIYQDVAGQPLRAMYFDNEGHVIHYSVSAPAPRSAVFLSDPTGIGPQYRLIYELNGAVMEGKFQIRTTGKAEWISYLGWSGTKK